MSPGIPPSDPNVSGLVPEEDIDGVLDEFGGDPRAAIRALLYDLDVLARGHEETVSHGFVRGDIPRVVLPSRRS